MSISGSMVALPDGTRLSCAIAGGASESVAVLLPGPTDSWRSYIPVLELVPPSIRVVAVSQRGHGESDKPPQGYRVEDFATDVVALLDEMGIERAVLAGHSGSCLVARRVAIDHPERVAGLLLEASPTTLKGDVGLEGFVTSFLATLSDPLDPAFARSFVAGTSSEELPSALLDTLVHDVLEVPARVWKEVFADLLGYDDTAELAKITAPTRLIWGDADDLVERDVQDALAILIPDAALRVYGGVGHTPRWEQPARFTRDLADIVERSFRAIGT